MLKRNNTICNVKKGRNFLILIEIKYNFHKIKNSFFKYYSLSITVSTTHYHIIRGEVIAPSNI